LNHSIDYVRNATGAAWKCEMIPSIPFFNPLFLYICFSKLPTALLTEKLYKFLDYLDAVNKMNKACAATTIENIICEDLTAIKNIKDGDDNGTRQTLSRFGVELTPYIAKNYDALMNIVSFGLYSKFISKAIAAMGIRSTDSILDLGCGTGRNASLMLQYLGDKGRIIGIDISPIMQDHFEKRFANEKRVIFRKQRIDVTFDLEEKMDIVFISFVIHGFPHEVRNIIIDNARRHLKPNGLFIILDFAEFNMAEMPILYRLIFKKIECKYAFDFIEKDWKTILRGYGFSNFTEHFYIKNYARLLKAVKQ
jgi:demethylmenaquinone methyltransferase/2-methoxy-6-polyprenyl-1,4-benzoquinol methylase